MCVLYTFAMCTVFLSGEMCIKNIGMEGKARMVFNSQRVRICLTIQGQCKISRRDCVRASGYVQPDHHLGAQKEVRKVVGIERVNAKVYG